MQVDLRTAGHLTYDAVVEPCRGEGYALATAPDASTAPRTLAMSTAAHVPQCYSIRTKGCTDPPLPNQEIVLEYTDPLGNPVYHTVTTDEHGCFEDFLVDAQGGIWQVDAEFPGNECVGPIDPPAEVVVVPPGRGKPVGRLGYSFHLGMSFPTGSFSENYDPGPSLTLDLEYPLRDNLSALGLIGFHYFHGVEQDLSWTNLSLNVRSYFPLLNWRWYAGGGVGLYMPNHGTNEFGINLGTGLNFPIQPGLSLDVGADYHLVDPSGNRQGFGDMKMGLIFRF